MLHRKYKPGQFICKYGSRLSHPGDMANEFYIVLSGDVGIYIMRPEQTMDSEYLLLSNIRQIVKHAGYDHEVDCEVFGGIPDLYRLDQDGLNFLSKISKLTPTRVVFKVFYLEEKLGCLPPKVLDNELFFNSVV